MKKVYEHQLNQIRAKIFKSEGEYVVKFYRQGVIVEDASYFTDSFKDAEQTLLKEICYMQLH